MRILLITHYFPPENGAPQRRWDSLIRHFVEAGHEVAVLCPPPHNRTGRIPNEYRSYYRTGNAERAENGALVFRVGYLPHRGDMVTRTLDHLASALTSIGRGSRLLRSESFVPDVIIATAPAIPTLIAGRWLKLLHRIPLIVEMRDAWPDLVTHMSGGDGGAGGAVSLAKRLVQRWVTGLQRSATQVVTTTDAFARVLETRGMRGVEVIRNGADANRFAELPARDGNHAELRALYLGTIGRSQGLDMVVRAAAALGEQGVDLQLRIIGDGHHREDLVELNRSLGSPAEILSEISPRDVAQQYAWADTTIASLRDWEPFEWTVPSKLYELLSTGRHVTGIMAGEGASILQDSRAGDVVAPGDLAGLIQRWTDLSKNPERLEIGTTGVDWVQKNVDFTRLSSDYLEIIERVRHD
ncbi:glycosyltransferase family 4 protein [Gulosibacter molinativorax]|uniref:D-inositol 3-phosphate glycosyltransferase n=1 Tax=Gulosibacter molinativorax TaxID=256821 RepID=A0ABT7C8J2_9MICO|nr:glycosyltransferase family 4 protein [Gulosibacter molinativorax]MDJ1370951.1 glycosyltransferase WbuB [Gulosibacter molinativorax]QUY62741.1 Glycosyl transferase family 1 [Gulosibacter molinativorax]